MYPERKTSGTPANYILDDLHERPDELSDLLKLLKRYEKILAKIPNVRDAIKQMEKIVDPSTKLSILPEELVENDEDP
ncbi:hypothetical protein AVEN_115064-1 [Araneus ventricosus]|uniref:Uncharacterized protein n=1 Tax=Araneus ventricosus TaxID=182803 RepID=A0A4Y1ZY43_ARAVE|nr:hypothetical protein AVEN_115064-1 [Araneus ventricosus]